MFPHFGHRTYFILYANDIYGHLRKLDDYENFCCQKMVVSGLNLLEDSYFYYLDNSIIRGSIICPSISGTKGG